jgi:hypothetical protein
VFLQAPNAPIVVVGTHAKSVTAANLQRRLNIFTGSFKGQPFEQQLELDPNTKSQITCVDSRNDSDVVSASFGSGCSRCPNHWQILTSQCRING